MTAGKEVGIDGHLSKVNPALHDLVRELRRIILESLPGASEAIKWRNLIYEKNGVVCGIVAHSSHVNLQFWRGAELTDPERLLEGTGKAGGRHVKVRTPDDVHENAFKALLKEADALDSTGR